MQLERESPCKVNFILNILGKRADGFHELETLLYPVRYSDHLTFRKIATGVELKCSDPALATDSTNLVYRAADTFLKQFNLNAGVAIHLEKRIPMAAGLGGGSGNAATTLLALNELFELGLSTDALSPMAATLGSDVPFFLQGGPALGFGRGEHIRALQPFAALEGMHIFLVHPGFGISTPWAYKSLAKFPAALNGTPGRAETLAQILSARPDQSVPRASWRKAVLQRAREHFYNSLEAPALHKFPVLALYQEFLLENGAHLALMSGSGSTTFAIFETKSIAQSALEKFKARFGDRGWTAIVAL